MATLHFVRLDGHRGDPAPEMPDIALTGAVMVLGRDVALTGAVVAPYTVNRRHARFVCVKGEWCVEDMQSRNGTYVNGARLTRRVLLSDGDRVALAGCEYVYRAG
ncbi:MAG: FHA domain-containing protein [Planctomycetes bacterium]|nr:FHA domain-containing protein [Planctomycetota bacterium]